MHIKSQDCARKKYYIKVPTALEVCKSLELSHTTDLEVEA